MFRNPLIFIFTLCAFTLVAQTETTEWQTLDKKNYSITFPDSWSVDNPGQPNLKFVLNSAQEGPDDVFQENVTCVAQDVKGFNMTLEQFVKLTEAQIPILIENAKIEESELIEKDGLQYQRMVITASQDGINLKLLQHYYLYNETAYSLTFTTEVTQYDNQKALADKVLKSFTLK